VNRRAFFWRLGTGLLFLFVVVAVLAVIAANISGRSWEERNSDGPHFWIVFPILFWCIVIWLVVYVVRRVGRGVRPMFDVIDASYRVSLGDYSVRVEPTGNPQLRNLIAAFNTMTEKLEINDQQRRRLLADIAHELRTPLAVIQGNVEGMIDGVYPRDDSHLEPLLQETKLISRLLDDLQTLSKAEAGALELFLEPTDPGVLIADTVGAFRPTAESADIHLTATIEPDLPEIEIDPVRIRQVIENLISNALRHTPGGGAIDVSASVDGDAILIRVRDTGSGVPADLLPVMFDRFVKSSDSGGSGLGLAIAKRLIEAHGGTIEALSEAGEGTEIRIRLPRESASAG
jgi:two-component system OmpR family sensor kinase/two-component system sensor histidine kinase BaeS